MDEAPGQPAWFQKVVEKESSFPPDVQRRLRALRKIQLRMVILDGEFYKEVYNVLAKCHNLYDEFYQRRADIISGAYEPTERDCVWDDEFPDNMTGDYSLPGDVAEAGRHDIDKTPVEDVSKKPGKHEELNAGNGTVKDEEQGKIEVSSINDETCIITEEKEVDKHTELAESRKEGMMEETRSNDEISKIVEKKEANEPSGLEEGEEITEEKRTNEEVSKIEEVKEEKEPIGVAEGGKEEMAKATGAKEEMKEDKITNDEVPKIGEVKEAKEPVGLADVGKEETREDPKRKFHKLDKEKNDAKAESLEETSSEELRGIPDFWLTIFMNVEILRDLVEEHDKPVLSHLIDIRTVYHELDKPMGFTLEFHFSPNQYFTNKVLTKDYDLILRWHNHDPFMFHGPKMTGCRGCRINWKDGQNVTVLQIIKKQTHKRRGTKRTITKIVKVKSFFDFFSPPLIPENPNDLDDESLQILRKDCQVAHYLWDGVNPSPLLFYTGEIWDHDDLDAYYITEIEGGGDEEV